MNDLAVLAGFAALAGFGSGIGIVAAVVGAVSPRCHDRAGIIHRAMRRVGVRTHHALEEQGKAHQRGHDHAHGLSLAHS